MNTFKTGIMLILLTLLFVLIGQLLGGHTGMIIAFVFALIMNFGAYWFSDKIVLKMYKARPLSESQAPRIYSMVNELCAAADIPMPKLYIVPMQTPNAFATGRNPQNAAVCLTQGIMNLLDDEELKGVLAHELGHVKNRDTLIQTLTATIAGAIYMLANMARWSALFGGFGGRGRSRDNGLGLILLLVVAIVAPICALLIQMAISRSREYGADAAGANMAHNPMGLASALRKLQDASRMLPAKVNPTTAHLFIVNPLSAKGFSALFSTHPPAEERIKRLESMTLQ